MKIKELVKGALTGRQNRKYKKQLEASQMTYEEWCRKREARPPLTEAKAAGGQDEPGYILYTLGKGRPSETARSLLTEFFKNHPEAVIVYGDEDVWESFPQGKRYSPWFKPDWSPDLFDSCFYFGSLTAVRREFMRKLSERGELRVQQYPETASEAEALIRNYVKLAGGYEPGSRAIGHISEILFHCEDRASQLLFTEKAQSAVKEPAKPSPAKEQAALNPLVSVVIPSKDQPEILGACLKALTEAAEGIPLEVLVVDNGSSPENQERIRGLLREIPGAGYLYSPMEFHFSRMCNLGAEAAKGRLLLFLNDDVELASPGCVEEMAALAVRPFTGAVGLKLYYPQSVRIQHAGITNLPMGPVHKLQFLEDDRLYYFNSNRSRRNVLAVTAACLMVEGEKFQRAGGFSEELRVAFNDVDFCFTLWELGYANVCLNDSFGYHHESLSRGDDEAPEKLSRLLKEREILYRRHPSLAGGNDPYYSKHLNGQGLDTAIRPAYETAKNSCQRACFYEKSLKGCRQDPCLMVRIESVLSGEICGYWAVLGDDSACYEVSLLLKKEEGPCFAARVRGQYRPDLSENMPDQKNVGLCGFWVRPQGLSEGNYFIGAMAVNKVTGLKLINFSSRSLKLPMEKSS